MNNKSSLILKYFQKADQLKITNYKYCDTIASLFQWMVRNDRVKDDTTSHSLNLQANNNAKIVSHQKAIIAGLEETSFLLENFTKLLLTPLIKDGEKIRKEQLIAEISGKGYEILAYERTILNILQRMSGIATQTNHLNDLITKTYHLKPGTSLPSIAATRKTPWMAVDKKAIAVGGGLTHRLNLADGILIKDNHLAALKKEYRLKTDEEAIAKALEISLRGSTSGEVEPHLKKEFIEIEIATSQQAYAAVKTFNKLKRENQYLALMFDNFSPSSINTVLRNLSDLVPSFIFEASGGIGEKNILEFAQTGVDIISLGFLTHSVKASNLSLEI